MFCGNCGARNDDNAPFCANCGAPLRGEKPQAPAGNPVVRTPRPNKAPNPNKGKIVGIVAAVAVILVAVLLVSTLFGGRGWEKTVNTFMDATLDADLSKMLKLIPGDVIDAMLEEEDMDRDELEEQLDEMSEYIQDVYDELDDYVDDWSMDYEIVDDDDLSKKEIKQLKEDYEDYMDVELDIKEGKTVEVEMTIEADGEEETQSLELVVIKVGRSWYLDISALDELGNLF